MQATPGMVLGKMNLTDDNDTFDAGVLAEGKWGVALFVSPAGISAMVSLRPDGEVNVLVQRGNETLIGATYEAAADHIYVKRRRNPKRTWEQNLAAKEVSTP